MKINQRFDIEGMSCAACVNNVSRAVKKVKGVEEVNVSLLTNSMTVTHNVNEKEIIKAVESAGYKASISKSTNKLNIEKDTSTRNKIIKLIISIILLVPLFYFSMGYMMDWPIGILKENIVFLSIVLMVLSLSIIIINNHFFVSAFKAIRHFNFNMDTLVALGSGVAFIYSTVLTVMIIVISSGNSPDKVNHTQMLMMNISFETAGMVPTLISIGKLLESYSKGKTTNALKALINLTPKSAHKIKDDKEEDIDPSLLSVNDIVKVYPGETIPIDGIIIQGETSIDESLLTGESLPIDKKINDEVKTATINKNGTILVKVTKTGEETTLNQMIKMVNNAANTKTKISAIADKVAGVFVPIIIGIALLTFVLWMIFGNDFVSSHSDIHSTLLSYSIERAIAVLVISCPCALGLATPVAIMVSTGKGAKNGILFKNALSMEEAGKIKYLLLDKTGTITKGHPSVTDIVTYGDEKELLSIAYALEKNSEHPLSIAIKEYIVDKEIITIKTTKFESISGKGIKAYLNNNFLLAGNPGFLIENNIELSKYQKDIDKLSSEGKTIILFAKNTQVLGLMGISDEIKDDSYEAINKIKSLGIIPIMLTGDNENAARYIANKVGIEYVYSSLLPQDKERIISILKSDNKVAMVGDGINDALSLTSADVGIAIGRGSDVALDSASIVLMKSTLMDAYAAIKLSKIAFRNIKENLFWAFFYNLIMIPIAAGVFSFLGLYKVAPWMGSAAMSLSSVFVVLNALRINLYDIYKTNKKSFYNKTINDKLIMEIKTYLQSKKDISMEKEVLIKGMMCEHCVMHITKALNNVKGVTSVKVSLKDNNALVSGDTSDEEIKSAIEEAGYEVVSIK